jgi:replicative DNA helicase
MNAPTEGFSKQTRAFPVPALLEGVGAVEGMLPGLRRIHARVKAGKYPGIATGLKGFDEQTGGLQSGVHILAAAAGVGKTTLALQVARSAARAGAAVLYLAFDEAGDRLALKLAAGCAGLKATKYLRGQGDPADIEQAIEAHRQVLSRIRPYTGPANIGASDVQAMIQEAMAETGATEGLVVVDYVQAWAARLHGLTDFRMAVTQLIGDLRQVAIGAGVPVLAIAAQNRIGQGQAKLSSLRESSDLEYTADTVCFLSDDGAADVRRRVTLACMKNRWGPRFDVSLVFDAEAGVFAEDRR